MGGMGGQGGIFYSSISQYAADRGIVGDEFEILVRLVRAMDDEYLEVMAERSKSKSEGS